MAQQTGAFRDTLVLRDVVRRFGERTVLAGVSLECAPGDTVAVVGPSGSGNSTLLNLIGSLDAPTAGSIRLGKEEITGLDAAELARYRARRVGFVFQEHHLLPQLTAVENVLLPTLSAAAADRPRDRTADRLRAQGLLERVGVLERADAFPGQLSGGERQRVALARALVNGPALLLCDEPTGNLDQANGSAVVDLLLQSAREFAMIVLMVTHNLEHAARFARRFSLRDGVLEPGE